ncbi:MAG TPA: ABC transporter permease, partial [Candidatus Udaeobacter sp.]|nr:ABC transporter permease [Candidatus Udaeobacter sp.]
VTIALAVGANTSIFTAVEGVLLKSFSFPEAQRLVVVTGVSKSQPDVAVSYPDYLDWRAEQRVFVDLAARTPAGGIISGIGEPERVFGRYVTASFFSTLRVQPQIGRFFDENEEKPGAARVLVIGDGLWRRRFNADPAVIGRAINYNGASWTVIGVLPANFDFYGRSNGNNDVFLPIGQLPDQPLLRDRGSHAFDVIARLRPGVSEREAATAMNTIAARLAAQNPVTNAGVTVEVRSLLRDFVGEDSKALLVTSAAAILLLLIACANVANLTLARASTREREIAVRLAVGSSRWRIIRLLMTESLLISLIGGTLGVLLAIWAVEIFKAIGARVISRIDEIAVDVPVLMFSLGTVFIATVLCGLLPAMKAARLNVEPALKSGARSSGGGLARVRKTLIISELTLALMLLISASLLVKSFWRLTDVNPGFDPQHVLTFRLRLPDSKYDKPEMSIGAVKELRRRISELPGVSGLGITSGIPLGRQNEEGYWIEGQPEPANQLQWPVALSYFVDQDLCRTLAIPLLAGRMLSETDTANSPAVVLVDDEFVRVHFGGNLHAALGRRLRFKGENEPWREIVGVVRHVTHYGLEEHARAEVYQPWLQMTSGPSASFHYFRAMDFAVKTVGEPNSYLPAIKTELRKVDNDLPLGNIATLEQKLRDSTAPRRFNLGLISTFALLALVLSAVGLYGVISYGVNQRTTEIGIRMAVGAEPKDVLELILREGLVLAVVGTLLGVGGALVLTRFLSTVLFGVSATDPAIYLSAAALLLIVAIAACFWPARKASAIQPLEALRYE